MKNIYIFTTNISLKKYWSLLLEKEYLLIFLDEINDIHKYMKNNTILFFMIDENSTTNIFSFLQDNRYTKELKILLFNNELDVHYAQTLLDKNISAYENSYIAKENLLNMLTSIENGNRWFFRELTNFIINKYIDNSKQNSLDFLNKLTQKERIISIMISDGLTNKEIAKQEKIALSTVKGHISHIFEKLNVSCRISLALKFKS